MIGDVYWERTNLIVALIRTNGFEACRTPAPDDEAAAALGWQVVYVETPEGQLSWHISPDEAHLIAHLPERPQPWDGHTTSEKYARLRRLGPKEVAA
jgi:hypothetical protein